MYVCNCNGVTEREIRGAVELGCNNVADLTRELGVANCCGKCLPEAARLVRTCSGSSPGLKNCAAAG